MAENSNVGSIVGTLGATDPDANATITLTFTDGNGSQHNNHCSLDANGTRRTAAIFDYQTNATALHIRVKATDEHNASLAKAFVISVTNVAVSYTHLTLPTKRIVYISVVAVSLTKKIAYGSDPHDPKSVTNHTPPTLNSTAPPAIN